MTQNTLNKVSYRPVIVIFSSALMMALAYCWRLVGHVDGILLIETFVGISMCILAVQKLKGLKGFTKEFLGYDLLAQRIKLYGYVYPFAELFAGVLMLAEEIMLLSSLIMFLIGGIGALSVFKAVYIDQHKIKCACVGGNSDVPLGFVSLLENVMMVVMALWMVFKP